MALFCYVSCLLGKPGCCFKSFKQYIHSLVIGGKSCFGGRLSRHSALTMLECVSCTLVWNIFILVSSHADNLVWVWTIGPKVMIALGHPTQPPYRFAGQR